MSTCIYSQYLCVITEHQSSYLYMKYMAERSQPHNNLYEIIILEIQWLLKDVIRHAGVVL